MNVRKVSTLLCVKKENGKVKKESCAKLGKDGKWRISELQ